MRITVVLSLAIEVPIEADVAKYLKLSSDGSLSTEVSMDYLADLYDDELAESLLYGDDHIISICGETRASVREALALKIAP